MSLLTVNAGSSSVRLALYAPDDDALRLLDVRHCPGDAEPQEGLRALSAWQRINAVAHRVVHGGPLFDAPCLIDTEVEAEIERIASLAPLHNPRALAWIRACRELLGAGIAQVAVFDTAFYAQLPEVARRYALPRKVSQQFGLRRYGFHGIAHQAMWRRWRELRPELANSGRVISLQLGAGCSITAIADGLPRDTSMGFSPLEGLVMATRAGDLDPGALLYLLREGGMTTDALDALLNKESGLLGLSGVSGDLRMLLASTEPEARLAVDLYCYRARKYLGAYLAVLGGADAILFGGGVGEHASQVRAWMIDGLEWAGVHLDAEANRAADGGERRISAADSRIEVWVIPVNEAAILAEAAISVLTSVVPTPQPQQRTT